MAIEFDNNLKNLYKETDIRKLKIQTLKENGINPYAPKFDQTRSIQEILSSGKDGDKVSVAGRVIFKRVFGKFSFVKISDIFGMLQVSIGVNELNADEYKFFKDFVDTGDYIGVDGEIYHTNTGELTVRVHKLHLLSKAMRPLPEKFHGLTDIETIYRQRYLDLITNEEHRQVFLKRSKMLAYIRKFLGENGFIEVETPILQSVACGAAAKPFVTKHNALDKTYNLRISPETYLKQVVAGGIPRVFELAKNFRNEGMDSSHLQEFTMLEWYASYWDYKKNIEFVQEFIKGILMECNGSTKLTYQGTELDFGAEWDRVDYIQSLNDLLGLNILDYDDVEELKAKVKALNIFDNKEIDAVVGLGGLYDYMYKRKIRPNIIKPTIVYNYPNLVPLARPSDANKKIIEMFQVLVCGIELVKAYSELVDPQIQRAGFEEQMRNKLKGDEEAFELDEDFLLAMEHGMPPMSGLGFGIDRFMTVMCDQPTIRDVVLFPNMK